MTDGWDSFMIKALSLWNDGAAKSAVDQAVAPEGASRLAAP
jgi:hypothetical protein